MKAGFRGGSAATKMDYQDFASVFSPSELDAALEAALLLKPTGISVASWTRERVPQEVLSVMAATMWGSLETLVRSLGGESPRSVYLESEDRRMLAMLVEPGWTLLLVGSKHIGKAGLRQEAQRLVRRMSHVRTRSTPRTDAVRVQE